MNKVCKICGHNGENVWRDGKYYCASCGCEVDVTQRDANTNTGAAAAVPVNAVCPICKNATNNTASGGKCHCALCGTSFVVSRQADASVYSEEPVAVSQKEDRRAQLDKERNNNLIWGVVCLFLFWPVSIYFFYRMYQITQEMDKL